jgi:hypothetical protein
MWRSYLDLKERSAPFVGNTLDACVQLVAFWVAIGFIGRGRRASVLMRAGP